MDLIVCMKQIPNLDLQFRVNPEGSDISRETLNYQTNGPDQYALEEAVRIKEALGDGKVIAVTVGPPRTEEMLREAMAKGADEAVRVDYSDEASVDAVRIARILSNVISMQAYDLILTGVQSDDYINSIVGGCLAGFLGVSHASVITKVHLENGGVKVHRELEGGTEEVVSIPLPAVLTIQYGINEPRYAPLPAIMRAARQPIKVVTPTDFGVQSWEDVAGPEAVKVKRMYLPEVTGRAEMLEGSADEVATRLAAILQERGFGRSQP
jgi:electron transfer flavoprotein beta subunit